MASETNSVQTPATEQYPQIEETTLHMEELEARVAPSAVWGD